jgi:hypothetical protein
MDEPPPSAAGPSFFTRNSSSCSCSPSIQGWDFDCEDEDNDEDDQDMKTPFRGVNTIDPFVSVS